MRTTPQSRSVDAYALDAYLRRDLDAPKPSSILLRPLQLLVLKRTSGCIPSVSRVEDYHGDRELALVWLSAFDILSGFYTPEHRYPGDENAAVIQCLHLFRICRDRVAALSLNIVDFFGASQELHDIQDDYALLTGGLALVLMESACVEGLDYARERCRLLMDVSDETVSWRYVSAYVGLGCDFHKCWRPGEGALGAMLAALNSGDELVIGASKPAPAEPDEEEDEEPAWVAEARAKAARDKAERERIAAGPSLLVLSSVDHLPGSAESGNAKPGKSVGTTARSEWAPFAGRHWPLIRVPDLAERRESLAAEFPYAEEIIDAVLGDLVGRPHVYVRPLILVGPPGSGKTRLARALGAALDLETQVFPCAGVSDGAFTGTSRQWSTGRASISLQLLKRAASASAMLVLDEIDKVGTRTDNGNLLDSLLPLLTPDASAFFDPFIEIATDLSGVSYVATANDLSTLRKTHAPLLDRFRVYPMPAPRPEHLPVVCRTVLADLRVERGLDEVWLPDLAPDEVELVAAHYEGGSLRMVRRLCETLVAARDALASRN